MAQITVVLTDLADGTVRMRVDCVDDTGEKCDMFPEDMDTATPAQCAFAHMYLTLKKIATTRDHVSN